MKYKVQSRWLGDDWHTVSSERAGHQEFDDLNAAIRTFEFNTSLARMCVKEQRVIDSDDKVIKYYDPEIWSKGLGDGIFDMR